MSLEGRWCICGLGPTHAPSDHKCRACGNTWPSQAASPECMAATPEGQKDA